MPPKSASSSNGNKGKSPFSRNSASSSKPSRTPVLTRGPKANNKSILNFFQKAPGPPASDQARITQFISRSKRSSNSTETANDTSGGLFFEDDGQLAGSNENEDNDTDSLFDGSLPAMSQQQPEYVDTGIQNGTDRYHEDGGAVKRRRLSLEIDGQNSTKRSPGSLEKTEPRRIGPFVDDSDDEDGDNDNGYKESVSPFAPSNGAEHVLDRPKEENIDVPHHSISPTDDKHPEMSIVHLDEQNRETTCPICEVPLEGMTDLEASSHVNQCLDAGMSPVPATVASMAIGEASDAQSGSEPAITPDSSNMPTPKDPLIKPRSPSTSGKQSPFAIEAATNSANYSAFSRIMTENVEASAWAAAAAREVASRGKRAAERTCPFYKIIPNFSICVDAFRYGAVEGCEAYFLSHFHSDHYIGLGKKWCHGPIYCSQITANLVIQQLGVEAVWVKPIPFDETVDVPGTQGAKVTMLEANHCPGSSIFLFEKEVRGRLQRVLHCGDFRAHPKQIQHPRLAPEIKDPVTGKTRLQRLDSVYLDTTYLNPKYSFPNQEDVIQTCAEICVKLDRGEPLDSATSAASIHMSNFVSREPANPTTSTMTNTNTRNKSRLCVVIGTYSIGKERICLGIARALNSKIYASAYKQRITRALDDPDLTSRLTSDPHEAQVHMHSLMEIRPNTLSDYLTTLKPHFSRIVGFRPTGWTYRPPKGRMTESPDVEKVLYSESWQTPFSEKDCKPQRGSTEEAACFGIPYSEHSSFRELTLFCCSLRIGRIVPTVNVGSATSRDKMKMWIERWEAYKRSNGLYKVKETATRW